MSNQEHKRNSTAEPHTLPVRSHAGDFFSSASPTLSELNEARPRTNPEAVIAGVNFVMSGWHDGHWADFNLPSRESDVWVTAYVLARLG